jgi:hypothetical protein
MGVSGNLAGFNAAEHDPQTSFDPLPAGWYSVVITNSEMKPTKDKKGQYLELELTVIDGEYKNRLAWDRLNLDNPNSTTVEIAQRALSSICHATGVMAPNDSSDLHDRPFQVKLSVRPAKDQYEPSNDVKGYRSIDGAPIGTPAAAGAGAGSASAADAKTPPWKRAPAKR